MRIDIHVHSKYSQDGILEIKDIVKATTKEGLNGIAITDHNTIKGGIKAREYAPEVFKIIIGSEVKTDRGEITGLFLQEEINSRNYYKVIDDIKEQDGIIIVPHPFDEMRKSALFPPKDDAMYIDCVEGFNSRCVYQRYNERAVNFAIKHNLNIVAGSDAHFKNEIGNAGIETDEEDIRKAILSDCTIFGKKSSLVNHVMTKTLKWWRIWR